MNFAKVIETLLMIGADLPAYRALFEQVIALFDESDQDKLKAQYAAAMIEADKAHRDAQALADK